MTPITATLHSASTIRLNFRYDPATVASVKALKGAAFVSDGKYWTLPIRSLDALAKTFGSALTVDFAVLEAKAQDDQRRVRIFVANLLAAGISLDVVGGRVTGSGGAYCADPWQREIDARADKIVALGLQHSHAPAYVYAHTQVCTPAHEAVTGEMAEVLRQAEILVTGMRNAAANEQAAEAVRKGQTRRRRAKVKGANA